MPTSQRRSSSPPEFGRDGITVMVDTDRALRARDVAAPRTPERTLKHTLLERVEGRRQSSGDETVSRQQPPAQQA